MEGAYARSNRERRMYVCRCAAAPPRPHATQGAPDPSPTRNTPAQNSPHYARRSFGPSPPLPTPPRQHSAQFHPLTRGVTRLVSRFRRSVQQQYARGSRLTTPKTTPLPAPFYARGSFRLPLPHPTHCSVSVYCVPRAVSNVFAGNCQQTLRVCICLQTFCSSASDSCPRQCANSEHISENIFAVHSA